jgi:hypothetical protein
MIEPRQSAGLEEKAAVAGGATEEDLDRDRAIQDQIVGREHRPHRALPEQPAEPELIELLPKLGVDLAGAGQRARARGRIVAARQGHGGGHGAPQSSGSIA